MSNNRTHQVVSRRNAGFGDNLFATAHAWYYAKKTNRKLVVSWAPSMYLDDPALNAFPFFFDYPDTIVGVPIIAEERVGSMSRHVRSLPVTPAKLFIPGVFAEVSKRLLKDKTPGFLKDIPKKRDNWITDVIKNGKDVSKRSLIFNGCYGFLENETIPFFDEIRLKPKYQKKVDDFAAKNFEGKTVIGVEIPPKLST